MRLPATRDHANLPDLHEAFAAIANCFDLTLAAALKARPSAAPGSPRRVFRALRHRQWPCGPRSPRRCFGRRAASHPLQACRSDGGRQSGTRGEAGPRHRIEIGPLFAVDLNRSRVRIGLRHVNAVAGQEVAGENGKIGLAERIAPARLTPATALASSFGI